MKTLDARYYWNANGPGKRSSVMSVTIRDKFCSAPMRQQHVPHTHTSCFVHAHLSCPYAVRSRAAAAAQYDKVNRDSGSCAPGAVIAVDDHCHSAGSAHAVITVLLGSPLRSAT